MSSKKLNPFKDFQSDQIQRSSRKIFTAHYACRNAALNLTPVTETTNGFIFEIINSLIESCGVRLTWFDCKSSEYLKFQSLFLPVKPQDQNMNSYLQPLFISYRSSGEKLIKFIFCDHVRNSHDHSVSQNIDITRRNLILITLKA